jgi:hypothetical protein
LVGINPEILIVVLLPIHFDTPLLCFRRIRKEDGFSSARKKSSIFSNTNAAKGYAARSVSHLNAEFDQTSSGALFPFIQWNFFVAI